MFVAGFIGSPAMNFIDVKPKTEGGQTKLVSGDMLELPVPDRLKAAVAGECRRSSPRASGRSTSRSSPAAAPGPGASVRATCDVVEFLGNEELLHVRVGDHDLVIIVDASHRVRPGDVIELFVPIDKIALFDAAEGKALH